MAYMGQRLPGRNNTRLAQGKGLFTADVLLPNQCFMSLVRSPYAHAEISAVNLDAAWALPGVVDIMVGADVAKATMGYGYAAGPDIEINLADMEGKLYKTHALSTGWIGYAGQPVVAVIAENANIAAKACELIEVDYDELPVVASAEAALSPTSEPAIPGWQNNLVFHTEYKQGDATAVLSESTKKVSGRVKVQRHVPVPLEPRAYVAEFEARTERLTVYSSTQMPHTTRSLLSATLGMVSEDVHIIQPDVGGGFGAKGPGMDEEILVSLFAKRVGRPVRWVEERSEYFLAGGHARETYFDFEAAYEDDGRVTALVVDVVADIGMPQGAWVQSYVTAFCLPSSYKIENCEVSVRSVVTNKCKWVGYRGFGKEVASFFMDRVLDRVADATGVERLAVKYKNFIPADAFPFSQLSGAVLDSGNYQGAMAKLEDMVDLSSFREEQAKARAEGRYLGIGFGFELTPEGCSMPNNDVLQGWDGVTVRMDPMGRVTVLTGVTSPGSGNETGIAQIVADTLGVRIDTINVVQGDTDRCPYGLGNFSSRSLMIGGSAAMLASEDIKQKILIVAGNALEVAPEDLEVSEGVVRAKGAPDKAINVVKVARMIYRNAFGAEAKEVEPGLEVTRYFRIGNVYHQPEKEGRFSAYPTWPFMAGAAIVEVDPESGVVEVQKYFYVHDCGKVINPMLVEANTHGALAQGLGAVLYEELIYDDYGQLLTTTLMDYTMPTAVEMPSQLEAAHQETPTTATPLGTKGAGESGVAAPMSAVTSAVEDALQIKGLALMELPIKPQKVWRAIQDAKLSSGEVA